MDLELIERAAHSRAQSVAQRADRPRQRRSAEPQGARASVHVSGVQMSLRATSEADGAPLHFNGYASVYERGYEMWDWYGPYTEIVSAGAGAVSLARADLDVPLVLQHQTLRRIARTTNETLFLSEDDTGLAVDAPKLDPRDQDVAYIAPKLNSRLIDEMSFMFRIEVGQWSPDYTEYRIERYDINRGDVAIVGYGANPHTSGYPDLRADRAPQNSRVVLSLTAEDERMLPLV
jgi:Escherichia/Staphylococcus phage prohead protease